MIQTTDIRISDQTESDGCWGALRRRTGLPTLGIALEFSALSKPIGQILGLQSYDRSKGGANIA